MTLTTYAIYRSPSDHPGRYVVRAWHTHPGQPHPVPSIGRFICNTLDEARAAVPVGRVLIQRMAGDDPCIVETWL